MALSVEQLNLCRQALAEDDVELSSKFDGISASLVGDGEIIRVWSELIPDHVPMFIEYLDTYTAAKNDAPQRYVDDPSVGRGEIARGRWRQAYVRRVMQGETAVLAQVLRRGFLQSIPADCAQWDEGRQVSDKHFLGNSSEATGISDTTSDNPERYLMVRFANVDPQSTKAIMDSLTAATYTNPTIRGGQLFAGVWHKIYANVTTADDGSAVVELFLARPQYTLNAYTDFGGAQETGITYLWGVPKDLAQAILDANKTGIGKSSSASYGGNGLVDIVLRAKVGVPENLTTSSLSSSCDTTVVFHFAWGYTEAAAGSFLVEHGGAAGAGVSRTFSVAPRGDGFFDAVVEETTVTYDAGKHKFRISTFAGDGMAVNAKEWGWNIPLTTLEGLKDAWSTAAQGVNQESDFTVTRKTNCTFDYVAQLVTETERLSGEFATSGSDGVGASVKAGANSTALPDAPATSARVRYELAAEKNRRGSFDWRIGKTTLKKTTGISAEVVIGETGVGTKAIAAKNIDSGDIAGAVSGFVSAARKRHRLQVSVDDGGAIDVSGVEETVQEVVGKTAQISKGATGVGVRVVASKNIDDAQIATTLSGMASGVRLRHQLSLSPSDDKTVDMSVVEQDVQKTTKNDIVLGTKHEADTLMVGENADPADVPTPASTPPDGETWSGNVDADDYGGVRYRIKKTVATERASESRVKDIRQHTTISRIRARSSQYTDDSSWAPGTISRVEQEPRPDGFFDVEVTDITPDAAESESIVIFNDGVVTKTLKIYFNQVSAPSAEAGVVIESPVYNEFGRYDYVQITTAIIGGNGASVRIDAEDRTFLQEEPVRTRFYDNILYLWTAKRTRLVYQNTVRYFYSSLTACTEVTGTSTVHLGFKRSVGYDSQRDVYFIDVVETHYGDWESPTIQEYNTA